MKKGFTVVELLVVVSIIVILSGIILANLASSRPKARDAKRISNLNQIQIGLEAYFKDSSNRVNGNGQSIYPPTGSSVTPSVLSDSNNRYLPSIPKDPETGADYGYAQKTDTGQAYCIGAKLENANNAVISQDKSCQNTTGNGSWCSLKNNSAYNYVICRE